MPRNPLTRDEFIAKMLKLKKDIDEEPSTVWPGEKKFAHKYMNKVLDLLNEYRY